MLLKELQILEQKRERERETFIIASHPESKADKYILVGSRCTCTLKRCNSSDNSLPYEIKDLALPTFTLSRFPEGTDLREGSAVAYRQPKQMLQLTLLQAFHLWLC